MTDQLAATVTWMRCPSCLRIWRPTQLGRIRMLGGWRPCCPDWECVGAPEGHPRAFVVDAALSAQLVAGQRLPGAA
ncbi:MAG TPA: hypothetical protein VFX49_15345 [Chloroflexota bacterium]|nr:hypothetical protein [Chloroflexota bacterium]